MTIQESPYLYGVKVASVQRQRQKQVWMCSRQNKSLECEDTFFQSNWSQAIAFLSTDSVSTSPLTWRMKECDPQSVNAILLFRSTTSWWLHLILDTQQDHLREMILDSDERVMASVNVFPSNSSKVTDTDRQTHRTHVYDSVSLPLIPWEVYSWVWLDQCLMKSFFSPQDLILFFISISVYVSSCDRPCSCLSWCWLSCLSLQVMSVDRIAL